MCWIGGSTIFKNKINSKEIDRKAVNVPDSLFGLLPQDGHRTRSSLLWIDPPPLSFCSSPSILFRLAMLREVETNKASDTSGELFLKKVPMFKYFNFPGKLACENIFIFAHNSKQGSKEGTTLSNALELRPIIIFDMRM